MDNSDHRRTTRVSISNDVILESGGRSMRGSGMDLSSQGISVWAPGPVINAPIRVTMAIDARPVILSGRVVRQFVNDGGAVWGIEFMPNAHEDSLQIVSDFVEARMN